MNQLNWIIVEEVMGQTSKGVQSC